MAAISADVGPPIFFGYIFSNLMEKNLMERITRRTSWKGWILELSTLFVKRGRRTDNANSFFS